MKRMLFVPAVLVALLVWASPASAVPSVFSGSSVSLAASASFDIVGGSTLTIILSNTAAAGSALTPGDMLSGLFFSLTGAPNLLSAGATAFSPGAIANSSACTVNPCPGTNVNVGGEWSYAGGGLPFLTGTNEGISSSSYLNANQSSGNLNGLNLQNPNALNGIEFGIADAGYVNGSGNGGVNSQALIRGSATFAFNTGLTGLTNANIGNVWFTYGISQSATTGDVHFTTSGTTTAVPEPASLILLASGLVLSARALRRKHR